VGIVTARDQLTIQWTADDISRIIHDFTHLEPEKARSNYQLKKIQAIGKLYGHKKI